MTTNNAASVDVWYQYDGVDEYVVSVCAEDGEEIRRVGGSTDLDEALAIARKAATREGVPVRNLETQSWPRGF